MFEPTGERIETLESLIAEQPSEVQERILSRHHLSEIIGRQSPFLPTLGIEVEFFASRYPDQNLPYDTIKEVEEAGIIRDESDSFPYKNKKWEAAIEPTGSHLLIMRELQQLAEAGLVRLTCRIPASRETDEEGNPLRTSKDYYPLHITFGGIQRDFPNPKTRPDNVVINTIIDTDGKTTNIDNYFPDELYYTTLSQWTAQEGEIVVQRAHKFSDCFCFARLLDASLWSTSPERLVKPYLRTDMSKSLKGHADKGTSGIKSRRIHDSGYDGIEYRTAELWGERAFENFGRLLKSGQFLGAALIAYQELPIRTRDQVLTLENDGGYKNARRIVEDSANFSSETKRDLALVWWDIRKQLRDIFRKYDLEDPGSEYWTEEFQLFAKVLKQEEEKHARGETNLVTEARNLMTDARRSVKQLIK